MKKRHPCRQLAVRSGIMSEKTLNSQSNTQRGVHFFHFGIGESADKIGKQGFWNADKIIAIYCAVVLLGHFYCPYGLCKALRVSFFFIVQ